MSGLVSLQGGSEHQPGFEQLDERLIAHVSGRRPVVAVLPLAASTRKRPNTARLALEWWRARGAIPAIAPRDDDVATALVRRADAIVLPGGVPDRLHRRLRNSPVWAAIVDAWRDGASVSGSSSGAIVLGERRQAMLPPFTLQHGLGLVPGITLAPHYDQLVPGSLARLRQLTDPELVVVGLDTSTGIVGRDGVFEVVGLGTATLAHDDWTRVVPAGEILDLRPLVAPETATATAPRLAAQEP